MCFYLCVIVQAKRTKKVGVVGKYGTRYGASLRKMVKKIEISQHAKYTCYFCGKVSLQDQYLINSTKSVFYTTQILYISCSTNMYDLTHMHT